MNLDFSNKDQIFREEVKSFIEDNLNKETARRIGEGLPVSKEDTQEWQIKLSNKGKY